MADTADTPAPVILDLLVNPTCLELLVDTRHYKNQIRVNFLKLNWIMDSSLIDGIA